MEGYNFWLIVVLVFAGCIVMSLLANSSDLSDEAEKICMQKDGIPNYNIMGEMSNCQFK
jgi:hypothetical protein